MKHTAIEINPTQGIERMAERIREKHLLSVSLNSENGVNNSLIIENSGQIDLHFAECYRQVEMLERLLQREREENERLFSLIESMIRNKR